MEVAFAKRAGKALIAAFLMKRPGNACLIVQAKESLIWNPKLVNVIKDSSAMIALPGFAVWIVDPMEGEFFQNYFLQSCKNETFLSGKLFFISYLMVKVIVIFLYGFLLQM